jgi:hypothetical protein
MTYLPIAALFARDAVEEQLDQGRVSRERASTPRAELAEPTTGHPARSRVRAAGAHVLRRLADRLEPAPLKVQVASQAHSGAHRDSPC